MKKAVFPMQALYSRKNSHRLFSNSTNLNSVFAIAARFICAFTALTGPGLMLKYFFAQKPAADILPAVFAVNILPAAAISLGLTAAFCAAIFIILRRSRALTAEKTALQHRLVQYRQDIAALAQNRAKEGAKAKPAEIERDLLRDLRLALDKAESPLWLRDKNGVILFANKAYYTIAAAQTAHKTGEAEEEQKNLPDIENLFSSALRHALAEARQKKQDFSGKTNLVLQGNRHIFVCRSFYNAQSQNFLCLAEDMTEKLHLQGEVKRIQQGYAETFDRLSTSVAIFDPAQKLEFFNSAFASLWPLENRFLESGPSHALLLDRLREKGILNERPDWRQWKEDLFEAYHSLNPQHYIWNLSDGRTLRVVANPHPQGGVTWLFDDLTEKLALQARYNTLIQMQGETLDNLSEGVAVFGSDGRLRLSNPAFAKLWKLPSGLAIEGTHIEKIKTFCRENSSAKEENASANAVWQKFALYITGFADKRDFVQGRTELRRMDLTDSRVFDYMLVPLPQGQTMLTFVDVTDSVNIARALHERNAALESADKLRNDFVQHVSYELRTPLTNIMGFTDLALSPAFGTLNAQQSSYLQHIAGQSVLLFNLVNDILDLATVDAGIMELNISTVSIAKVMHYVAERLKDRLEEKNITLEENIADGLTQFEADEARIRQIFINLLNNAIKAAPENSHIRFSAEKYKNYIAFTVEDEGPGIPPERLNTIFKRFTSYAYEKHKTGVGLGLSIVKSFVELHQGHVLAENGEGKGTKLICRFPFHDNGLKNE